MMCAVCIVSAAPDTPLLDVREAITVVAGTAACAEHTAGLMTANTLGPLNRAAAATTAARATDTTPPAWPFPGAPV